MGGNGAFSWVGMRQKDMNVALMSTARSDRRLKFRFEDHKHTQTLV